MICEENRFKIHDPQQKKMYVYFLYFIFEDCMLSNCSIVSIINIWMFYWTYLKLKVSKGVFLLKK